MCKLYAIQAELTRQEAEQKLRDKIKIIRRTEDDGLGIVLQVGKETAVWKCGESIFDVVGGDILSLLDDFPQMATLAIHGRSATSKNTTVDHAHPRETELGPLMHNGVVRPKAYEKPFLNVPASGPTNWLEQYELDTDYLAELANRGLLENADLYLEGYAAIILVSKMDQTLVVQNQGANLYMNVKHGEIEFGTTLELCPGGNKFDSMRAEAYNGTVYCRPITDLGGRTVYHQQYSSVTSKDDSQKKSRNWTTTGPIGKEMVTDPGAEKQKLKNKKGRKYLRLLKRGSKEVEHSTGLTTRSKNFTIVVDGKIVGLEEHLKRKNDRDEEEKMLKALREVQKDRKNATQVG